ncbi:MAG: methyltransferase domain-containing protein [Anaerolineales bacterium]|nr:methyltransferase domain-containing protein [Anaerolineales bacterium]
MQPALAHQRYSQQAAWTAPARRHLLAAAGLHNARRVLEVGCGTGAILSTLSMPAGGQLAGLDIDRDALALARQHAPAAELTAGDAHALPYPDASFDIAFCHFVLLWVAQPAQALAEMRRVVRRGGAVLALAEPDYSQRTDAPNELAPLGRAQSEALRARGADPTVGGRLPALFAAAGLQLVDSGLLQTSSPAAEGEAATLRADLSGHMPAQELERWLVLDAAAWAAGTRQLHVPTFYAFGRVS